MSKNKKKPVVVYLKTARITWHRCKYPAGRGEKLPTGVIDYCACCEGRGEYPMYKANK